MRKLIPTLKTDISIAIHLITMAALSLSFLLSIPTAQVNAAAPYLASDVLGQDSFTATADNGQYTNNSGHDNPNAIAIDAVNGRLFVADNGNSRILVYNTSDGLTNGEAAVNVLGQTDFTTKTGDTTASKFSGTRSLAYDSANNRLFVSDWFNNRIMIFDTATITNGEDAVNVLGQADFTSSGSDTNAKGFNSPSGITYANNRLFVVDENNHRVLVFDTTTITDNEDAVNVLGQANFTSGAADTNAKGFFVPSGILFDSINNRLFVADRANRVLVFDTTTITDNEDAVNVLGQANFTSTGADTNAKGFNMSFNDNGISYNGVANRLYVSDPGNHRVLVFDTTTITDNEDAVNVLGQADFTSGSLNCASTGTADAKGFCNPIGVAYNSVSNNLFIADINNHRVLVFDTTTITDNEDAVNVLGQANFTSGGRNGVSAPTANYFDEPHGSVVDSVNHRLFVGEEQNHRVLVFNLDTNNNLVDKTADFVLGQPDFNTKTEDGVATAAKTDEPQGLAFDATNNRLFVTDPDFNRMLVFDTASITNGENAVNVLGQANFTTGSCAGANASSICGPEGNPSYDSVNNRLYVASRTHHRVLVFDTSTITNGEDAANVLGQANFTDDTGVIPGIG